MKEMTLGNMEMIEGGSFPRDCFWLPLVITIQGFNMGLPEVLSDMGEASACEAS